MTTIADQLWDQYGQLDISALPDPVVTVAHQSILDWFGCALAGSREPVAHIVGDEVGAADGPCSIVGSARRGGPRAAALVNGTAGHALDFDDTNTAMGGHPTAPLLPAVLAVAERDGRSGADVVTAYVVGMEVQARIGIAIGDDHYAKGWHTTSTIGVFGACAGASWLLGLDHRRFGHAMGIAASSAAGLKANFGTMTKPLHPGRAAEAGVMAALLAARGFTANGAAIEANQGFAQAAGSGRIDERALDRWRSRWATLQTLFKHHAACHLTHAGIEAARAVLVGVTADEIDGITLTVNPAILDVCGIPNPTTGLEAKFSLRGTQALTAHGYDTAAVETFEDGPITQPGVQAFLERVRVDTDVSLGTMCTTVVVTTASGTFSGAADVGRPDDDLDRQGRKLRAKFTALARPVLGAGAADELADLLTGLTGVTDIRHVMTRVAAPRATSAG
jgi:2-methylcitrate dehydratase PrpD